MILSQIMHDFFLKSGLDKTYWVAFSGGLDSQVLLSLCHVFRMHHPFQLKAIHINHGFSPSAKEWTQHCAQTCDAYQILYIEHTIEIKCNQGESWEEIAREKRYAVFAKYLQKEDVLLTAHHQDDQAETVLLQLLRGAGPKGLSAMPPIKPFAQGFHGRPLLSCPRIILETYAKEHQLTWINDESNANLKLTRNFIRHDILPRLKTRWPTVSRMLTRSAKHCSELQELLEETSVDALKKLKGSLENTLSVQKLLALDLKKQKCLLRIWIQQLGYRLPDTKKLEIICLHILRAKKDRMPMITWDDVTLRRYRDDLFLTKKLFKPDVNQVWNWHLHEPLFIPYVGKISATLVKGRGLRADIQQVLLRFRRGGEVIYLEKMHRTLKNLFQEWAIPPWQRSRIPLIYFNQKLIAIAGYAIDNTYAAKKNEMGYEFTCID